MSDDEPSILGAGCGVQRMPTVREAIEYHVRQIQQLCDAANLDPYEWLMPDLEALDGGEFAQEPTPGESPVL
ncbi:MAG: hypothetical protein HC794_00785 [Nitrospiraceae bacterium]|nr:hypothetical protein [Nitrospiraceae bacterium]